MQALYIYLFYSSDKRQIMKKGLLCLFVLLCCSSLIAQNVSIELSIHWQVEKDIFNEDTTVNTPFLSVTYRNNSDENLYFKKIPSPDEVGVPETGYRMLLNRSADEILNWRRRAEISLELSPMFIGNKYVVDIGNFRFCLETWNIVNEMDTCRNESDIGLINDDISEIHQYIYHKKYTERLRIASKLQFKKEDLSEDSIMNVNRNYFVFLKPKEIYTDTFNLIAFQLIKGHYTFGIGENSIPDFVEIEYIWDNEKSYWLEQTAKLPVKVGEYHLYSGSFFTNTLTVDFSKY